MTKARLLCRFAPPACYRLSVKRWRAGKKRNKDEIPVFTTVSQRGTAGMTTNNALL